MAAKLLRMEINQFSRIRDKLFEFASDQANGHITLIAVRDTFERSMWMEAFQFVFSGETSESNANVAITIRHSIERRIVQKIFRCVKIREENEIIRTLYFQAVDNAPEQAIMKEEYLHHLLALNLDCGTLSFLFSKTKIDQLSSDRIDLRPFLERALVRETVVNPEYQNESQQILNHRKLNKMFKRYIEELEMAQRIYEAQCENNEFAQRNAVTNRDFLLLQLMYQHKCIEREVKRENRENVKEFIINDENPDTADELCELIMQHFRNTTEHERRDECLIWMEHKHRFIEYLNQIKNVQNTQLAQIRADLELIERMNEDENTRNNFLIQFSDSTCNYFEYLNENDEPLDISYVNFIDIRLDNTLVEHKMAEIEVNVDQLEYLYKNQQIAYEITKSMEWSTVEMCKQFNPLKDQKFQKQWHSCKADITLIPETEIGIYSIKNHDINEMLVVEEDILEQVTEAMICFTSKYNDNETVFNGFCDTVGWIDENVDYDEYRHLQLIRDDFELEKEFRKCIESDVALFNVKMKSIDELLTDNRINTREIGNKMKNVSMSVQLKQLLNRKIIGTFGTIFPYEGSPYYVERVIHSSMFDQRIPLRLRLNQTQLAIDDLDQCIAEMMHNLPNTGKIKNDFEKLFDFRYLVPKQINDFMLNSQLKWMKNFYDLKMKRHNGSSNEICNELQNEYDTVLDDAQEIADLLNLVSAENREDSRILIDGVYPKSIKNVIKDYAQIMLKTDLSSVTLYRDMQPRIARYKSRRIRQSNIANHHLREHKLRVDRFEERFERLQRILHDQSLQIQERGPRLHMVSTYPALESSIHLIVDKQNHEPDDESHNLSTLSTHQAALWLLMAINQCIESPILIFDSFDYLLNAVERALFREFATNLSQTNSIQTILMFIEPPEVAQAMEVYLTWNMNVDDEAEETVEVAQVSDLVVPMEGIE